MADTDTPTTPTPDAAPAASTPDAAPKPTRTRRRSSSSSTRTRTTRTRKPRTDSKAPTTSRTVKAKSVGAKATDNLAMIGVMVRPFHQADSDVLLRGATPFGQSLDALCAEYPSVERIAEMVFGSSALISFVLVTASIAVPIAANHGAVPAPIGETASTLLAFFSGDVSTAQLLTGGAPAGPVTPIPDELADLMGGSTPAAPAAAAANGAGG